MFAYPFFRLKIGCFKARVRAPIDVKTGSPDPADFATTRTPIRIFLVAYRIAEKVYELPTFGDMFLCDLPQL
jgi:hypothetical protein